MAWRPPRMFRRFRRSGSTHTRSNAVVPRARGGASVGVVCIFSAAGRPQEVGGSWYLKRNPPTGAPCRPFPTDTGWVGGKTKPEQPHAGLPAPQQHGAAAPQKPAWPSARLQGSGSCEATVMTASTPRARQSRRKHSPASTTRTSERQWDEHDNCQHRTDPTRCAATGHHKLTDAA